MSDVTILNVAREALYLSLLVSLPVLGVSLVVGLVFGILQAATQIQEQTLSFVPRLAAVLLTIAIIGSWMGSQILRYTEALWEVLGRVQL
jgi:flagellar biosynthetic protein FliQ